ncbi:hypothetical protein X798_02746 [Onchocerca flexuosa]|uniref:Uncharacterized protein n=1 Tax=Onchocerca flexuosa TaxID=387005 RepID=A0A238BZ12_9BILA|nr:hypothetical protein X798_02746 [Onchocerca flexuosa]
MGPSLPLIDPIFVENEIKARKWQDVGIKKEMVVRLSKSSSTSWVPRILATYPPTPTILRLTHPPFCTYRLELIGEFHLQQFKNSDKPTNLSMNETEMEKKFAIFTTLYDRKKRLVKLRTSIL